LLLLFVIYSTTATYQQKNG